MSGSDLGASLLRIGREAIASKFGLSVESIPVDEALNRIGATFVTLKQQGELRGCVGTLEPVHALRVDVGRNAIGAAFRDTRFPPLTRDEFDITSIEVSLLSASQPLLFADENELLAQLRPAVDGVALAYGRHHATFLPQVWKSLPEPCLFLTELRRKAGLPPDFWHAAMQVSRYQVMKWKES